MHFSNFAASAIGNATETLLETKNLFKEKLLNFLTAIILINRFVFRYTDIEPEFERIKINDNSQVSNPRYIKILMSCHLMKPLLISMTLMFFQQFSGINAIIFYSASIFQEAGSTVDRYLSKELKVSNSTNNMGQMIPPYPEIHTLPTSSSTFH